MQVAVSQELGPAGSSPCSPLPPRPAPVCTKDIRGRMGRGQQQEGQLWLPGFLFSASAQTLAVLPPLDSFSPFGVTFLTFFPTVPSRQSPHSPQYIGILCK